MGPPSSGGVAVLQILKQLERFDLAGLGPDSPVAWHLFGESQRLAYADVYKWQGDADFVQVPVAGLTDPAYTAARSALISPVATMTDVTAGTPAGAPARVPANDNDVPGTTNFVAVDARGGVATYTATVEQPFGSGLVAGGFILNNELTDFNFAPAAQGELTANRVQPGKRPRSAMAPTIVTDANGRVVLAIGGAGGITIIAQVAKTIIGVVDWKLSVQDAIAAPQLIALRDRFQVEQGTRLEAMRPAFEALGHVVTAPANPFLKLNGAEQTRTGWRGGADPRTDGRVAGLR
jgi:gamma-glutamyltranspeptidase/glutathione hydrolase